MKSLEDITKELNELTERANGVLATAEADHSKVGEAKALLDELQPQVAQLTADRDAAIQREELANMKSEFTTLQGVIEDLRKNPVGFVQANEEQGKALDSYAEGRHSIYMDVKLANKGDQAAKQRLIEGMSGLNAEGKAMTEGTAAQGGYLVRPAIERQIVEARELDNVLRAMCSKVNVTTNAIQLDQLGLTTTAGWVAELAQKPEATGMTLASVTASVFTAAGLVTVSNQLLADSSPSVDGLVTADLRKRLVALEETAFIDGSGTGQPLGILNTPGIGATPLTSTEIGDLLDAILTSIAKVESAHGAPSAILMHPRTWTRILLSKDAAGAYYIAPSAPGESYVRDARTVFRGPQKFLWGYPVVTTNRMPITKGGGTESRVVVGDFSEALILDRQGITIDESPHVYFTTNQTVFRAETRLGFTAARTPQAFDVIGGAGLANG